MATFNLGKVCMVHKGDYDNTTSYEKLDVVRYNGATYISIDYVTGETPSESSKWKLLAADGVFSANAGDGITIEGMAINVSKDLLNDILGKADKATTLGGYGITDAYTKSEVDTALSGKVDNTVGLKFAQTNNIDDCTDDKTLYRVYIKDGSVSQGYHNLICINQTYKKAQYLLSQDGKIQFRVSSKNSSGEWSDWSEWFVVVNDTDLSKALATKADTATTYTKTEVDEALADKPDTDNVYTVAEADEHFLSKYDAGNTYATKANLATKADTATTYTKTEVDTKLSSKSDKATTLAGYGIADGENIGNKVADRSKITDEDANYPSIRYLEEYYYDFDIVDGLLENKADKETTYTKNEVDTKLSGKIDNTEGAVKRDNIDLNAVGTDEIDSGAVDTVNIADRAVTADKLADNVNQELIINTLPKFMSLATVTATRVMYVDGQYLYHCGNSSYAVSKNDISVEVAPTQIKKIGGHTKVATRGMAAGNGYLYVPYRDNVSGTGTTHGSDDDVGGYLDIINLSDFSLSENSITYTREPYDPGDGNGTRYYGKSHNAATYADKYLCVTQQLGGWLLYDIETTPENPTLLYKCDNRAQSVIDNTEFQQPAFYTDGTTVYLAIAGYDRHLLKIYNLNTPTYPICVYSGDLRTLWQHGDTAYLHTMGLVCKYPYIYCTVAPYPKYMTDFDNTMQGVAVVDVSDINRVKVAFYEIPNESRTPNVGGEPSPQSVAVTKNHLVMDMFDKGISVWSLANPSEPKFLGNLDTGATKVCSVLSTEDGRTFIGTEYQGGNLTMYRGL